MIRKPSDETDSRDKNGISFQSFLIRNCRIRTCVSAIVVTPFKHPKAQNHP
ncbi:unnamed protein product [Meloidogyne enterolobii]|uniref:Uncharacterized protein n=1 Tax=Meloidogyne enterolobii TaxID=390850 RepID=A0ACB0ZK95_MELEN